MKCDACMRLTVDELRRAPCRFCGREAPGGVRIIDETTEITPEAYNYLALKADAERLAELRRSRDVLAIEPNAAGADLLLRTEILIAVYEELAGRGLTFGGGK